MSNWSIGCAPTTTRDAKITWLSVLSEPKRVAEAEPTEENDANKENKKKPKKARTEPGPSAADDGGVTAEGSEPAAVGSGRRAAQGDKQYREASGAKAERIGRSDKLAKVEEHNVDSESSAIEATGGGSPRGQLAKRRCVQWSPSLVLF